MNQDVDRLVCAVIHNDDANSINQALVDGGYRATRLTSQGGFLRRGNVVFLIGVPQSAVDEVVDLLKKNVKGPPGTDRGGSAYGIAFVVHAGQLARL
jgi:uncharacterized protein YaaQ